MAGIAGLLWRRWPTWLAVPTVVVFFADGPTASLPQLTWSLPILPVLYLVIGAIRGELRRPGVLLLQLATVPVYVALMLVALTVDQQLSHYLVAAGWLAHAGWDLAHHRANRVVPRWYAEWCAVVDVLVAVAIVALA